MLVDKHGIKLFQVSDAPSSCTKYINSYAQGDVIYCDCPGLEDTDGFITDMVNTILIGQLFAAARTITLVIVLEFGSIEALRGEKIRQLIKTIT